MESRAYLAERADRLSRSYEADTLKAVAMIVRQPVRYINTVLAADAASSGPLEFDKAVRKVLSPAEHAMLVDLGNVYAATPGEDAIQLARWARHRVIYVIDPDTAKAVEGTDWSDAAIPGEVLRRLPHPNPMVILPEPVRVPSPGGVVEKYECFLVLGVRAPRARCDTTDDRATHFVLHFLGRVVDPATDRQVIVEGIRPDGTAFSAPQIVGMRVLTPLMDASMRQRQELAASDVARFELNGQTFLDAEQARQVTHELTSLGLSLLTYLVTDDVDASPVRLSGRRIAGKGKRRPVTVGETTAATVIEVGYRVGAALRAADREQARHSTGDGKRTVTPHVRRAHMHTFRRGPRSNPERFIKWLPPIAVNAGKTPSKARTSQIHFPS